MEFAAIRKQLEKLSFVEEAEASIFLNKLEKWITELENLFPVIKARIDIFTLELVSTHQEQFSIEASKLDFKTFIFKSKANNLKVNDLIKGLNTPQKIIHVAGQLNVDCPVIS